MRRFEQVMRPLRLVLGALALLAASFPTSAFGAQPAAQAGSGGPGLLVETLEVNASGDGFLAGNDSFPVATTSTLFRHDHGYRLVISGDAKVRAEIGDATWFENYSSAWPAPEVRGELTDGVAKPPAFADDPNGNPAGAYLQIGNATGKSMMPIWGIEGEGPIPGWRDGGQLKLTLGLRTLNNWCEQRTLGGGAQEWTCPSLPWTSECRRGLLSLLAAYPSSSSCPAPSPLTFQWRVVHAAATESIGGFTVQVYDLGDPTFFCRTSGTGVCEPGEAGEPEDPLRSWRWSASASKTLTGQPLERIKKGTYRLTRVTLTANGTFQIVDNEEGSWRLDAIKGSVLVTYVSKRVRGKGPKTVRRQIRAGPSRDLVVEIDLFGVDGAASAQGGVVDWETTVSKSGFPACRKGSAVRVAVLDGGAGEPDVVRWRVCNSGIDFQSGVARESVNTSLVGEA